MAVRAEWDQLLRIGPRGRSSLSSWLAPGATETSGVISLVDRGSRLSKPSFYGEVEGHQRIFLSFFDSFSFGHFGSV